MIFHSQIKDDKSMLLNKTCTLASFKKLFFYYFQGIKNYFLFWIKIIVAKWKGRGIIRISSSAICTECKEFFPVVY